MIDLSHARTSSRMRAGDGMWCYIAPEQQRGGAVGAQAHIWGLATVLHAAATGRSALAEIADELDNNEPQLHARVPSVRALRPRLRRALTDTIDKGLAPDPAGRPPLAEVLHDLKALA